MIVRVEIPGGSKDPHPSALVYSKDRLFYCCLELTEEALTAMKGQFVAFFYARINHKTRHVELAEMAPWQDWEEFKATEVTSGKAGKLSGAF